MRKVAPFLLLTYVVLAHYANYLILLLPLSVISKAICLTLSSFVFSSAALLVILVSLATWNTTRKPDGLNHQVTQGKKSHTQSQQTGPTTLTSDRILDDFPDDYEKFRWRVPF
ncbi:hypothetical protein [Teseptimavirus T7]|uniref:Protein 4.2 n=2 Tax=Escherichia phage T7 TaxID=10760 RepID=Y42_BPT7|nr:hypothetical protein T7p25 [Escherichia phage T7]P03783.1 RecName: Full=Protein 4.2; AltName: Full=Gene product 4.2; Short=Gp4.2 [Escherichia phage T7]AXQ60540.1 hypothetical protein [Synthetic phage]AAP33932.1 gene 4.2 [Escherichia phage T7]AVH85539.1 hypothetical protein mT7_p25 [Escherichia phage T7]AXQ60590.1 hypothetical protein [Synthetic phage]AXY87015.1 hypothetical protein [Synthetic phage]